MEVGEIISMVFQYGGTVIMAGLFVWVFVQDKTKNSRLLEENTKMLDALTKSNETLSRSNDNIAKSLDLIQNNILTLDNKSDRNYTEIIKCQKEKNS
jgi:type VI protein secretion system component VasK